MRTLGLNPGDVQQLYLAGGFANYVDVQAAIDIGFLAPVPTARIAKVGNAAAQEVRAKCCFPLANAPRIEALAKRIEHVELETTPDFFELFVEGCPIQTYAPQTDRGPPSEQVMQQTAYPAPSARRDRPLYHLRRVGHVPGHPSRPRAASGCWDMAQNPSRRPAL